jgi:hypothetical protein
MGYKLLMEMFHFENEKNNYTCKEQEFIEKDFKKRVKEAISKIGKPIIKHNE